MKKTLIAFLLVALTALPAAAQQITPEAAARLLALINELAAPPITLVSDAPSLHTALRTARPGAIIQLAPGVYEGNFLASTPATLDEPIVLQGSASTLRSPSGAPALTILPGASYWRFKDLIVTANGYGELVRCGLSDQTATTIPHHITFDGLQILGDPVRGAKRGISLNCNHATFTNSIIAEIKGVGQDTQGIAIWNAYGPFTITANRVEAAGENLMVGGADPSIPGLIPADLLIDNNRFTKPLSWRGTTWTVKNIVELKSAQRATITNNYLAGLWTPSGQDGYAVVMKSVNQDGTAPWSGTSSIEFAGNTIEGVSGGFKLAGKPEVHPAVRAHSFNIHDNTIVTDAALGGTGRCVQIMGVAEVTFEANTCMTHGTSFLYLTDADMNPGLTLRGNIFIDRAYGIKGDGTGEGLPTLMKYAAGTVFEKNLIVTPQPSLYASLVNTIVAALPTDTTGYGARR